MHRPIRNVLGQLIDELVQQAEAQEHHDPYRLNFHLMPPTGWLNDPNGLCHFAGRYHVFFQYSPFGVTGEDLKVWGQYSSEDLVNWRYDGTPILADGPWDCHGVYSGSAFVENNVAHIFYSGNVKAEGDHDYVTSGRLAPTIRIDMDSEGKFGPKAKVIDDPQYPDDYSCHVRDPKVWKEADGYHLILGGRKLDNSGAVLHYASDDLTSWRWVNEFRSTSSFGYMWECPDVFSLDRGELDADDPVWVLSVCPQGVPAEMERFQNVYQSGYFLVESNPAAEAEDVVVDSQSFVEWDCGFDFYAPQTFEDPQGRRLLIGWAGLPDIEPAYRNPIDCGWQHALTVPREVTLRNGQVRQYPVPELEALRGDRQLLAMGSSTHALPPSRSFDLVVKEIDGDGEIRIGQDLSFSWSDGLCVLALGAAGLGRDRRLVRVEQVEQVRVLADTSLVEIFVNEGEKAFTTRYYPTSAAELELMGSGTAEYWSMA